MTDDFKFTPLQLKPQPQGPFGLSGESKFGLGSRTSTNPDAPGRGSTTSSFPTDGGYSSGGSGNGGGGGGGGLPSGTDGSLLRYNGTTWVSISPPSGQKNSLFANSSGGFDFIQGNQAGGVTYFNGLNWEYLDGSTVGERVFILRNGQPEWLGADAFGTRFLYSVGGVINWGFDPPDGGTYVLGSIDGHVQWIETESCEEEP